MRTLALIIFFIGLATTAAATEKQLLNLWYHVSTEAEQAFFEAQVGRFNEQNPDVELKTLVLPQSAFNEFVIKKAEGGTLPDLLYFQSGSLSKFVWSDLLLPLNQLVPVETMENATEAMRQQGTYPVDGRIYALSPTSEALTLYANKALLESAGINVQRSVSAPWSKTEFYGALQKLQSSGVKWPLDMQLYHADDEWYLTAFSPFFQASGGDIISRTKWDAQIALQSLFMDEVSELLLPMLANEWIVPSHKATQRFERGRAGLSLGTTSHYSEFREALGEDLVVLPFPVLGPHHVTSSGSWSFGVTSQTNLPREAAEFISFVMSDREVLAKSDHSVTVPATHTALDQSELFSNGGVLATPAQQFLGLSRPKPLHPAYPVIRATLADALDDILAGSEFKTRLAEAAQVIDADIARNQNYPPFNEL